MRWLLAALLALVYVAPPVAATQLVVHLADDHGRAISDAVVTLAPDPVSQAGAQGVVMPASIMHVIDQKDETFIPYVQIFRPGDSVVFRNSDTTRHHVYSFSNVKRFEFVLRPGEGSPAILLDKSGVIAVGCNIHDQMVAYLFISPATDIALSDKNGDAVLNDMAAGSYTAHVWHAQLPPGLAEPVEKVAIASGQPIARLVFTFPLLPDPRETMDRDHAK